MASIDELELLSTVLSRDRLLFTIQRNASHAKDDSIRVDCFASKELGSPSLMRITGLVAKVLNRRRTPRGLTVRKGEDIDQHLVAALSRKLDINIRHIRVA